MEEGWYPDTWLSAETYFQDKYVSFLYVPKYAGVTVNEEADRLAAHGQPTDKVSLYKDVAKKCAENVTKEQLMRAHDSSRKVQDMQPPA